MPYDEGIAEVVRQQLQDKVGYSEKKMFGGLCFLINGNMAGGIVDNRVMVRIGKDAYEDALLQEYVTEMDFNGRPMRGMIYIDEEGSQKEKIINEWIAMGYEFANSLPPK